MRKFVLLTYSIVWVFDDDNVNLENRYNRRQIKQKKIQVFVFVFKFSYLFLNIFSEIIEIYFTSYFNGNTFIFIKILNEISIYVFFLSNCVLSIHSHILARFLFAKFADLLYFIDSLFSYYYILNILVCIL